MCTQSTGIANIGFQRERHGPSVIGFAATFVEKRPPFQLLACFAKAASVYFAVPVTLLVDSRQQYIQDIFACAL